MIVVRTDETEVKKQKGVIELNAETEMTETERDGTETAVGIETVIEIDIATDVAALVRMTGETTNMAKKLCV